MTVLGGRSRRKLRGVTLVVSHENSWTTEWLIKQTQVGVKKAQGEECPLEVFVLVNEDQNLQIQVPGVKYESVSKNSKTWIPRVFRALRISDAVIVSGIAINKEFAKHLTAKIIYLPILVDALDMDPHFLPGHSGDLNRIAKAAKTIFFNSEDARSTAEYVAPALCERTRVLRPGSLKPKDIRYSDQDVPVVVQSVVSFTPAVQEFFGMLHNQYREMTVPPRTLITGAAHDEQLFLNGEYGDVRFLPGVEFKTKSLDAESIPHAISLVDDISFDRRLSQWSIKESLQLGATPISLSKVHVETFRNVVSGETTIPLDEWAFPVINSHGVTLKKGIHEALRPDELLSGKETKVVLAASDFKFSSALVKQLDAASDINFVVDKVANNSTVNRQRSTALAGWSDVVITEFLNEQAVWYSNNLPRGKRLIVHMHGFELYGSFANRINLDGVDQVVVPSEGYKQKVIEYRGWPESKLRVIHNSGSLDDLVRPKDPDARFTLGIVGWVPALKRIDRALDVLETLIEHDERYALEVRGAPPWDYTWEWNTPAHRDTYVEVLHRLHTNPKLAEHVTFSPFGPDVGNWLRGIGWILSPSFRESFHLAPVEGMLSGAIPLVWTREGAEGIFGSQWVLENTDRVVERVLAVDSQEAWDKLSSQAASDAAVKYNDEISRGQWHETIVGLETGREAAQLESENPQEVIRAVQLASRGEFLAAWEDMQQNGNLALGVSREFGLAHSAWVRGHVRLSNKLLALQHEMRQLTKKPSNSRTLLVQVAALGRQTPRDTHGGASLVLVKPPAGSPEAKNYIATYFAAFQPMVEILGPDPSEAIELDTYLEVLSGQLVKKARAADCTDFRVDGPYWAVLAALMASAQVNGHVDWDLTSHTTKNYKYFRPNAKVITDDPLELSSIVMKDWVRHVIVSENSSISEGILAMFSADSIIDSRETRHVTRPLKLSKVQNLPVDHELPRVSVILPSYRTDGSVIRTLESIYNQTYPLEKIEVQIVLNGRGLSSRTVLDEFIRVHPGPMWRVHDSETGVAYARNKGIAHATGDYLTFVDDDDYIETNYLASLVAASTPDTVVMADIIDVDNKGQYIRDTNTVRRVKALGYEETPAFTKAGLFGACGGKLLASSLVAGRKFNPELTSGEDVAFLGPLVANEALSVRAAHRMTDSAYVRTISSDSISHPSQVSAVFAVHDRLAVAYPVWKALREAKNGRLEWSVRKTLIEPQIGLMQQYLNDDPDLVNSLHQELANYSADFSRYVRGLVKLA